MKPTSELSDTELREAVAVEIIGVHVRKQRGARSHLRDLVIPGGVDEIDYVREADKPELTVHDLIDAVPAYESSIEAAFEVVAKMRTILNRWGGQNRLLLEQKPDGMFKAAFYGDETNWEASAWVDAATAPRAICIAALTAVRARKP